MIPAFAIGVVGTSFNAAFIPVYVETRQDEGEAEAKRLLANVSACSAVLLGLVSIALAVLFPLLVPVIAGDFPPAKRDLTVNLFYVMLPAIVLSGVAALWGAALNSVGRFALAAVAPALAPAAAVAFLLARAQAWGGYALALGVAVGALGEAAVLWVALRRRGIATLPRWRGLDERTRLVLRQYVPTTLGAFLMGTTVIVDQTMATTLGSGSVSTLNYGQRIVAFALGIAGLAVGTGVMPFLSGMVASRDYDRMRETIRAFLRIVLAGGAALAVLLFVVSTPLVRILFQRGSFTAADTADVSDVQRLFALQIPFYLGGILLVRVVASLRANRILTAAAAMNVVVNVVLNYVLMRWIGVAGIALSTSFVYLASFLFVYVALRRRLAATS
jgi:putative peptidoglycan lipid II flippase